MTQLNQIIAVEKGIKGATERALTNVYHEIQSAPRLSGISRTYTPKDDEGDRLPPESTLVQVKTEDALAQAATALTRLFDVTATKEVANASAVADVVVGGQVVVTRAPVTYLLFLEKQLINIRTLVAKLPTLDPSETWTVDPATNTWATAPTQTTRTKKVPRNWVKSEATDKHPAQVEVYHEDVIVGTWSTTKFSGALPAARVSELLGRVDALVEAVKFAREEANSAVVTDVRVGDTIFGYLFG